MRLVPNEEEKRVDGVGAGGKEPEVTTGVRWATTRGWRRRSRRLLIAP